MPESRHTNSIYVVAGVNGAGKSSVLSAPFLAKGVEVFNPDAAAQELIVANPGLELAEANSVAWRQGRDLLERAINQELDFAFETTLGGQSITALLQRALASGQEVLVLYVGLATPELHIQRVRHRAASGGHDIPDDIIRRRYDSSRGNLIRLLPRLTELRVFDNSAEADPEAASKPTPIEILRTERGRVVQSVEPAAVPEWAKPIVAAALDLPML